MNLKPLFLSLFFLQLTQITFSQSFQSKILIDTFPRKMMNIRGTLSDFDCNFISNAQVLLYQNEQVISETNTDSIGNFQFKAMPNNLKYDIHFVINNETKQIIKNIEYDVYEGSPFIIAVIDDELNKIYTNPVRTYFSGCIQCYRISEPYPFFYDWQNEVKDFIRKNN